MLVGEAKAVARRWVDEAAAGWPGFGGAVFHGSINRLTEEAALPSASDVDVLVVLEGDEPPPKIGKFVHRGVLLEVSFVAAAEVASAEAVSGRYDLADSFRTPSVVADPTGRLAALHEAVAKDYAKRRWVRARCDGAEGRVRRFLGSLGAGSPGEEPFAERVTACVFAAGVTTHVLLVAGLRNPTVRTRYVAVRELLAEFGRDDAYGPLLEVLGCARMERARAERHLAALAEAFDAAAAVIRTPFVFAADIGAAGRPVAIGGSREMIARGDHREAVFWMAVTAARCQAVFRHDAPGLAARFGAGFRELIGDLGLASDADLQRRGEEIAAALPWVRAEAEAIIAANPAIDG